MARLMPLVTFTLFSWRRAWGEKGEYYDWCYGKRQSKTLIFSLQWFVVVVLPYYIICNKAATLRAEPFLPCTRQRGKRGSARRVEISLVDTYFKTDACCVLGFVAHTCDLNSGAF